jgi:type IV secretion system protein VirB5
MKRIIVACTALLSAHSFAAGIPVFDAANVMQAITSVQQLKAQLEQQKQIYQAMNGSRGMGNLLNDPALRNYLPADWQKVYDQLSSGGLAGLSGSAAEIRKATKVFDCERLQTPNSRYQCEVQAGKVAQDKAFGLAAYEQSVKRVDQIEALMRRINDTSDPKAIAELNARLQAENALIQNEQIKLQMFQYLSQAEDKAIAQRKRESTLELIKQPANIHIQYKKYE